MTVAELIAKLQLRPGNMEVIIPNQDNNGETTHQPLEIDDISVQTVKRENEDVKVLLLGTPPEADEEENEEEE